MDEGCCSFGLAWVSGAVSLISTATGDDVTEATVTCFSGAWPTCRDSTTLVWIEELLVLVVVVVLELVSFDRINFANRPKRSRSGELFEDDVGDDGTDVAAGEDVVDRLFSFANGFDRVVDGVPEGEASGVSRTTFAEAVGMATAGVAFFSTSLEAAAVAASKILLSTAVAVEWFCCETSSAVGPSRMMVSSNTAEVTSCCPYAIAFDSLCSADPSW